VLWKQAYVYLQPPDGSLRRLLWFKSHRENWLLWSPFGLSARQATMRGEWQQQFVNIDDNSPRMIPLRGYSSRESVIDHFGWHPDGVVLLKNAQTPALYSQKMTHRYPLGPASPIFLELHVQTEVASEYRREDDTPEHAVLIPCEIGSGVALYVAAAGRDYPMHGYLRETARVGWKVGPLFQLGNFLLGTSYRSVRPDIQLSTDRLKGTLIGLRFQLESRVEVHKTFLFT
jgi:hypothetical protein